VSGQDDEKFRERAWRTLEDFFFTPLDVAMVHQLLSFESMPSRMQRKPFLRTSAPQIDSLKALEMSAMTIHLIFYLPLPRLAPHMCKPGIHKHETSSWCLVGLENHHQLVLQLHK